jgi:hypothetical protein
MGRITLTLYLVAGCLLLAAAALRVAPVPIVSVPPAELRPSLAISPTVPIGQPSGVTEAIVAGNVFAASRTAPRTRYTPSDLTLARSAESAAPAARRPTLRLFGTVVGPSGDATALIDANPAVAGAEIYRVGDMVGAGRVVVISDSTVVIQGAAGRTTLRLPPPPATP